MEVYLVRHTQVGLSPDYCYGISDVELGNNYLLDIAGVKEKLKSIAFSKAFTSGLKRCKMLAESIVENPIEERALLEMNLGEWELKKWSEIDQKLLDNWMNDFVNISPPGAMNFLDFSMQSVFFFDDLVAGAAADDKILLVTHSGVIRSLVCHVLNLSLAHAFNFEIDFGSVTKIEIVENWYKIKYLNL
jgi:alpha-ribazole phosphatase